MSTVPQRLSPTAAPSGVSPSSTGQSAGPSAPAGTAPVTTFEFFTSHDHCELRVMPALNEVHWGDVEQVGTTILDRLQTAPTNKLLVDLSPLNYMGSAQVALLVRVWKMLKARDGKMVVQVHSDVVHKVLTIAGLHTLWDIVPTQAAAFQALGLRTASSRRMAVTPTIVALVTLAAAAGVFVAGQVGVWPGSPLPRLATQMCLSAGAVFLAVWSATQSVGVSRIIGFGVALAGFLVGVLAAFEWPR
jgi:anti-anti-sigma factor